MSIAPREKRTVRLGSKLVNELWDLGWDYSTESWPVGEHYFCEMIAPQSSFSPFIDEPFRGGNWTCRTPSFYGNGLNRLLDQEANNVPDTFEVPKNDLNDLAALHDVYGVPDTFEIPTIEEDIEVLEAVCMSKTTHPDTLILADILRRMLLREKFPIYKMEAPRQNSKINSTRTYDRGYKIRTNNPDW